jgi:raffinose/stachyose/melibiose transport system permease protein
VARLPRWPSAILFGIFAIGLTVPAQAVMIPQYVQFDRLGLRNSLTGLILADVVVTLPVAMFILAGFMRTLPAELYEAAELDGAGPWATFRRIAVPVSYPSIAATAIFLVVMHWNDLLYPLLFIDDPDKRTLPLALLDFQGEYLTDYPLLFTGVVVASLPMVLAYAFLQRHFIAGITAGAVKG